MTEQRTALISVYDKTGVVEFARTLEHLGWKIIASGGTAAALDEAGIFAQDTATIVGGKAILGHRVVTLSREIHAGLLAQPGKDDLEMATLGLDTIELVYVNFYPLEAAIAKQDATGETVIESTDIGGPTMVRSAAKGKRIVICDPADCASVLQWLKNDEPDREAFLNRLAAKAEFVVSKYCLASTRFRSNGKHDGILGTKSVTLRYGENAGQSPAAYFSTGRNDPLAFDRFERIEETPPSMVNVKDVDRLLQTITHIAAAFHVNYHYVPLIAVGCKHGNPCGAAYGKMPEDVITNMVLGDPVALFGGMVITNFPITVPLAELLLNVGGKRVLDGVIAPSFDPDVFDTLKRKDQKCRLYSNPALESLSKASLNTEAMYVPVRGGFVLQPNYTHILDFDDEDFACSGFPSIERPMDSLLAWAIGSTSNSNTITLVKNKMLIGNGVGQQDRVTACKIALLRAAQANHDPRDAIAYSDSFFPFPDGPKVLADAGIQTILATRGSKNDGAVNEFCAQNKVALWTMPDSKGRGFFGH